MKKFVAIPLIILILFTGITINLASHYCSGTYIASRISFSGELATCGMEHSHHEKPGIYEQDHSCQDITYSHTFNNNYVPSNLVVYDNYQWIHFAELTFNNLSEQQPHLLPGRAIIRPPGNNMPNKADPEMICIFRI